MAPALFSSTEARSNPDDRLGSKEQKEDAAQCYRLVSGGTQAFASAAIPTMSYRELPDEGLVAEILTAALYGTVPPSAIKS